jgi:hypothetical protein
VGSAFPRRSTTRRRTQELLQAACSISRHEHRQRFLRTPKAADPNNLPVE